MEKVREIALSIWAWLQQTVLTPETLIQLAVLVGLGLLAHFCTRWLRQALSKITPKPHLLERIEEFLAPVYRPLILLVFVGISSWAGGLLELPVQVFGIAENLLAAWVVIRLISGFIRIRQFALMVAVLIWTVAALNIFGLLDPLIVAMKGAAIQFGEATVSAYDVVWGILSFILLVWVAIVIAKLIEAQLKAVRGINPSIRVLLVKVSKIVLITVAFLVALNTMGIDLTALAVFGGALGVGIGFGLQKVVSNFISGVILLMDRSIKPGDVIQIQDTFGSINKLAGRYTSVITRDGTEFLIPNEDMITQSVINWSHTDRAVRRKIPVGVSYSTDLYQARQVMCDAAAEHERVLENPKPVTHVIEFGDNGVLLELRMWINDPENGVTNVSSEVMLKIWDKFHEKGIEIPFPQRVIHYADKPPRKKAPWRSRK